MAKFQRYLRLTESRDYQRDKRARCYHSRHVMCVAKSNGLSHSRLGLVVGKKVAPKACQRAKIKRHFRESFRNNYHNLPQVDVIFIARRGITGLSNAELRSLADEQLLSIG